MSDQDDGARQRSVPSGRLSRFGHFGRLAAGVAGGMVAEGARRLANGERPRIGDLMLTPANVLRVADRLSHLRGAAMKLGQMISMDAGDFLPPDLTRILERLRDNAHHMPPQQLQQVLGAAWGKDWRTRFRRFEPRPIAAASIGQVHRAVTHDGRELAIKIQYPGVSESIASDVDNVATLLRVSNLLPADLDLAPLLAEAKCQLAEEADYRREGEQMRRFGALLADHPGVIVPTLDEEFTTDRVLAMSYCAGLPIESLQSAPQVERDRVMDTLITLVLRELLEFGVMQTDPNFANYRIEPESKRLILLDFGATRDVGAQTRAAYRALLRAGLERDPDAIRAAAVTAGFLSPAATDRHRQRIDAMIAIILGELHRPGPFDFGDRRFVGALKEQGMAVAADKAAWHIPPADVLFVQRKISGTALLAARLGARVDVRALVEARLAEPGSVPLALAAS